MDNARIEIEVEFTVRDYECDMDRFVNNAVYLNYLEHTRHELLKRIGINFKNLSNQGFSLVVTRIEADYRASLISDDCFYIRTSIIRKGRVRLIFKQEIFRKLDKLLILNATVTGTALNSRGRPEIPIEVNQAINSIN